MRSGWSSVRNVLAVRLDNLGDVLMTTPALAAIRHGAPGSRLTLLASPVGAALAGHVPVVNDTIAFDAPWVKSGAAVDERHSSPAGAAAGLAANDGRELRLVEQLAARRFDAAIIFTVCTQSALPAALLCRMAGIPRRLAHARENPYGLLTDWVHDTEVVGDGMRHEVERQLALVASVGLQPPSDCLLMRFSADDVRRLHAKLNAAGFDATRPYFVLHPGASAASRRWPAERFGDAAQAIAASSGCAALFTGSAAERALIDAARAPMQRPSWSLAGLLELGELAALIAGARVLVANNSGPVHIAAAVGTPVVDVYALTNPQHTPWRVRSRVLSHDVPCRNCLKSDCPAGHHQCLRGIGAAAVASASVELMELAPALPMRRPPLEAFA